MRLRSSLLLISVATLVPLALLAFAGGWTLAQRERDVFQRGAVERVRALMSAVDIELRSTITTLEALAVMPDMDVKNLESLRPALEDLVRTQPGWVNFVLTSPKNIQILNLLVPPGRPIPPSIDNETVERAVRTRKTAVSDIVRGAALRRPVITVRTPVIRNAEVRFLLSAVLEPTSLKQLVDRQSIPEGSVAAIIDANFRFIVRSPAAPNDRDEVSATLRNALQSGNREGWMAGPTLEGVESYRAYARSAYSGWAVAITVPRMAYERATRDAALLFGLGTLLAMAAGVGLAVLVARRISGPIASLAASAPRLGHGEDVPPTKTNVNEVLELDAAFRDAGRAIAEREAALRAADRAKDEFLAMLGHELRNPLATLSTAAELLALGRSQPDVIDKAGALIARQTAHMSRLIDDLLEAGRVTGGKIHLERKPLDLAELAGRVAATWRSAGRLEHHQVEQSLESAWILADPARIEQIISNLVDNAVKYTPAGGRIFLKVRREAEKSELIVADEGQGLAPELIDRAFDLFVQGNRSVARQQGGLGIGLTLVKRLAELHGALVSASSAGPGQGATFTVSFPRVDVPAPNTTVAVPTETPPCDVLVVDDNRDARESLAKLLELCGHRVRVAADGAEALSLAREEPPGVALVDIGLPDMSGYEVASRLRAERYGSQLVLAALTGYGRPQDRDTALREGFDAHFTKPVQLVELQRFLSGAQRSK